MFHLEFNYHCESSKRAQFTENFYCDTLVLATAIDRANAMGALLAPMHGAQTTLIDCRIHNLEEGMQRKGTLVPFAANNSVTSTQSTDSDYPTTAISILLRADDGTQTRQWLKGLPDTVVQKAKYFPGTPWDPKFTAFRAYLLVPTNLIRMRVQTATPDRWRVDGITADGVITLPPNNLVDDDLVKLTGQKIPKDFRGEHTIIKVDDAHVKLYGVPVQNNFTWEGKAELKRVAYDSLTIRDVLIVEGTSHKVHKEKK